MYYRDWGFLYYLSRVCDAGHYRTALALSVQRCGFTPYCCWQPWCGACGSRLRLLGAYATQRRIGYLRRLADFAIRLAPSGGTVERSRRGAGRRWLRRYPDLGWFHDLQEVNGTLSADATPAEPISQVADQDWPAYGRNCGRLQRFSPLKQINADNVHNLKEARVFRTGDLKQPNDPSEITNEVTPIKIGNMLYLCTAHQRVFASDAATGKENGTFDPQLGTDPSFQHVTCRGVSYHEATAANASPDVVADCPRRIILPVNDGRICLNADTGKLCESFAIQRHSQPANRHAGHHAGYVRTYFTTDYHRYKLS